MREEDRGPECESGGEKGEARCVNRGTYFATFSRAAGQDKDIRLSRPHLRMDCASGVAEASGLSVFGVAAAAAAAASAGHMRRTLGRRGGLQVRRGAPATVTARGLSVARTTRALLGVAGVQWLEPGSRRAMRSCALLTKESRRS